MKPIAKSVVVALVLASTGIALAQTKPNFSGTWIEVGGQGGEMFIKHDVATIMIGHPEDATNPRHAQTFNLDGKPTKQPSLAHPTETDVSQATWDGNKLVLAVRMENGVEHKRALSLQPDGSLVVEVTATKPGQPPYTMKGTFKKK